MTLHSRKPQTQMKTGTDHAENTGSAYPAMRMRRLRRTEGIRNLVRETALHADDLILPLFVEENLDTRAPVASMPGVFRETEESLAGILKEALSAQVKTVMLFGVSHNKDHEGTDSLKKGGLLYRMIDRAKQACPEMTVIADLCFCEYTDHGHCGPLDDTGDVDNDRTLDNLGRQALIVAEAGADILAPSGMMDGMVGAIRNALDGNGYAHAPILSYAAKFASAFYGPFRDAAGCSLEASTQGRKDRTTYQMDPANALQAMREVELDVHEGADMVMVKPGLPYLDIIWRVKERFAMPTFAYNVSGEYAMLRMAADAGLLQYDKALLEMMLSFKRAGTDGILTYAAIDAARIISEQK